MTDRVSLWSFTSQFSSQSKCEREAKKRHKLPQTLVQTWQRWTRSRAVTPLASQHDCDTVFLPSSDTIVSSSCCVDQSESLVSSIIRDREQFTAQVCANINGSELDPGGTVLSDQPISGVVQRYIAALEMAELESRRSGGATLSPTNRPQLRRSKKPVRVPARGEHSLRNPYRRMRLVPTILYLDRSCGRDSEDPTPDGGARLGFGHISDQIQRKAMKKGFNFTIMVVGESGLGKSTLINSLLMQDFYKDRELLDASKRIQATTQIEKRQIELGERGVKLRLTVVDTPGFLDPVDASECWKPIAKYIDDNFERYLRDESDINRQNIQDHRVHCCLYFISPFGRGLRPVDVDFMKRLHHKVNIVPVIAKADAFTASELQAFKQRILSDFDRHNIDIYRLPDCESDEDEEIVRLDKEIKSVLPFAVIGSNCIVDLNGEKRGRGREYPWGVVDIENSRHCDFTKLRLFLLKTHMQDLKEMAVSFHYERYRADYIKGRMSKRQADLQDAPVKRVGRENDFVFDGTVDPDVLLRQKEEELQRMQQMVSRMQEQLKRGTNANAPPVVPTSHNATSANVAPIASKGINHL